MHQINSQPERSDICTDAHRFNYQIRNRLGIAPGAVGRLGVIDATKAGIIRLGRQARRLLHPDSAAEPS